jgi:hypothetical protein
MRSPCKDLGSRVDGSGEGGCSDVRMKGNSFVCVGRDFSCSCSLAMRLARFGNRVF